MVLCVSYASLISFYVLSPTQLIDIHYSSWLLFRSPSVKCRSCSIYFYHVPVLGWILLSILNLGAC